MFIAVKMKVAQSGRKKQCVVVPKDLKKVQIISFRACDKEYLIFLVLKHQLTCKSTVKKQKIDSCSQ